MINNKTSWLVIGLTFIMVGAMALVGLALLAVWVEEIADEGWGNSGFLHEIIPYYQARQTNGGNEFTGEATAWLFGIAMIPVGLDLISRTFLRRAPVGERVKGTVRRINNTQRKYLMPLHTYLSILALGVGILHLSLSSCVANPLPEWALMLAGILVATGLLFKWKAIPAKFRKGFYQFHASLIVSGTLLVILYAGHAIMD